jgi:hypothetical protein
MLIVSVFTAAQGLNNFRIFRGVVKAQKEGGRRTTGNLAVAIGGLNVLVCLASLICWLLDLAYWNASTLMQAEIFSMVVSVFAFSSTIPFVAMIVLLVSAWTVIMTTGLDTTNTHSIFTLHIAAYMEEKFDIIFQAPSLDIILLHTLLVVAFLVAHAIVDSEALVIAAACYFCLFLGAFAAWTVRFTVIHYPAIMKMQKNARQHGNGGEQDGNKSLLAFLRSSTSATMQLASNTVAILVSILVKMLYARPCDTLMHLVFDTILCAAAVATSLTCAHMFVAKARKERAEDNQRKR